MKQLSRGILIAIEGIDGSGKTVLSHHLHQSLIKNGYQVILTKEPGGSALGRQLRSILQESLEPIDSKAEYLLFAADRAQHIRNIITPAIANCSIVLSDRLTDSSIAYQGYGRGLDISIIKTINAWVMNTITIDLTLYVSIDIKTAQKRLHNRGHLSRFDAEHVSFIQRVQQGFEQLYYNRTDVITLDGTQKPEMVAQEAFNSVCLYINHMRLLR